MLRCEKCKHIDVSAEKYPCSECDSNVNDLFESKNQTNADRIRHMSDEELAEFLEKNGMCELCEHRDKENCFEENCKKGFLKWLQSEAEEQHDRREKDNSKTTAQDR